MFLKLASYSRKTYKNNDHNIKEYVGGPAPLMYNKCYLISANSTMCSLGFLNVLKENKFEIEDEGV
jgi:hypothetical protein